MADSETDTHERAAALRTTRIRAPSNQDLVVVTHLLACWRGTRTRFRRCWTTR